MIIAVVSAGGDLASVVAEQAEILGHTALRVPDISAAAADGAGMVFVQVSQGPDLAPVWRQIAHFAKAVPPLPIVAVVPGDAFALWNRARAIGAFDALFDPPQPAEIRDEIKALTGASVPFNPVERDRFEAFRKKRLIGEAPAFLQCLEEARRAAQSKINVLLLGESGSGKDVVANLIHHLSTRANRPFVALNCGAIPPELAESELFGANKGAYTGANQEHQGVFELVGDGTLFLDEIGDLRSEHQVKLLRAVEQREFRRLGASFTLKFNGRLICATARDLDEEVKQGHFRLDLLGRINQLRITLPALRERPADIPALAAHFLRNHTEGREVEFSASAMRILSQRQYTGNIRSLENTVIQALTTSGNSATILPMHLPDELTRETAPVATSSKLVIELLADFSYRDAREQAPVEVDRHYLGKLLRQYPNNRRAVAREAGIDHKTLASRLKAAFPSLEDAPDE